MSDLLDSCKSNDVARLRQILQNNKNLECEDVLSALEESLILKHYECTLMLYNYEDNYSTYVYRKHVCSVVFKVLDRVTIDPVVLNKIISPKYVDLSIICYLCGYINFCKYIQIFEYEFIIEVLKNNRNYYPIDWIISEIDDCVLMKKIYDCLGKNALVRTCAKLIYFGVQIHEELNDDILKNLYALLNNRNYSDAEERAYRYIESRGYVFKPYLNIQFRTAEYRYCYLKKKADYESHVALMHLMPNEIIDIVNDYREFGISLTT